MRLSEKVEGRGHGGELTNDGVWEEICCIDVKRLKLKLSKQKWSFGGFVTVKRKLSLSCLFSLQKYHLLRLTVSLIPY